MELIDTIPVLHQGKTRTVDLFVGDLAAIPKEEAVDVLVVSAFPDDYYPTWSSLIGALDRAGVSVAELSRDKDVDLRTFSSCWLSRPVSHPNHHFRRILCFEPEQPGRAAELVGDIFRSIVPFTAGTSPISRIAMPLVASGNQGESPEAMLWALADAAAHWMSNGLPLDRIKIVLRPSADGPRLRAAFGRVKAKHLNPQVDGAPRPFWFDAFISYSHQNKDDVDFLVRRLIANRPDVRLFVDRLELQPGHAWQQHIFDSLDQARKVICVLTPDYLKSRVCKEEFNIALFRHRESADGVLLPVYLRTADLPTYMKMIQYEDAREANREKVVLVAERLVGRL